jgi:acetolactate synthase regulatory subunit
MSLVAASAEPPTACFAVNAAPDPGVLLRVIEPFAKRGLVPSAVQARLTGDRLRVDLQVAMPADLARVVTEALRQIVSVERVLLAELAPARAARP